MSYAAHIKEPRPGHHLKKGDLLAPGAAITLAAFSPENGASMAVLRWTNPSDKIRVLSPGSMQVAAVEELPLEEERDGLSAVDVPAARAAIAAALPLPADEEHPVYVFIKDTTGASGFADETAQHQLHLWHEGIKQAVEGLAVTVEAPVSSNVLSRSFQLNFKARATAAAVEVARLAFPQAAEHLREKETQVGLAGALLVAAHVVGVFCTEQGANDVATPTAASTGAPAAGRGKRKAAEAAGSGGGGARRPARAAAAPAAAASQQATQPLMAQFTVLTPAQLQQLQMQQQHQLPQLPQLQQQQQQQQQAASPTAATAAQQQLQYAGLGGLGLGALGAWGQQAYPGMSAALPAGAPAYVGYAAGLQALGQPYTGVGGGTGQQQYLGAGLSLPGMSQQDWQLYLANYENTFAQAAAQQLGQAAPAGPAGGGAAAGAAAGAGGGSAASGAPGAASQVPPECQQALPAAPEAATAPAPAAAVAAAPAPAPAEPLDVSDFLASPGGSPAEAALAPALAPPAGAGPGGAGVDAEAELAALAGGAPAADSGSQAAPFGQALA